MKKKLPFLSLAAVACGILGLTACGYNSSSSHTHTYMETVIAPTCTESGYTLHTCKDGDDSYKDNYVDPIGHDWDEGTVVTPATVTSKGEILYTCNHDRSHTKTEEIPKLTPTEGLAYTLSDDGTYYSVQNIGTATDTDVIVAAEVNGIPVTAIADNAFSSCASLTSIVIPDSVTTIGEYAFLSCMLTSVTLGNGVTAIADNAFRGCSRLTSITIPDSVTSIGSSAFYHCDELTSVTIGNGVTSIGSNAFDYCNNLTSVYLTDIAAWCNISFGSIYSSPLPNAHDLYLNGELVTDLVIPDGVASIGKYAFYGYSRLTSVTIPDSVAAIGEKAFYECSGLTSVTLGNGVTSIGSSAFQYCYKLVEVYNLSDFTITTESTENGYVGYYAYNVYTALSEESELSITDDGFIFYNYGESVYLLGYKGEETDLTLPDNFNGKNYRIYSCAFYGCNWLTSVTIPDGITAIAAYMFMNCRGLTSVTIPDSVTSIGSYAFYYCNQLTSINIPDSVTSIESGAFYSCSGLTSITFEGTVEQWNAITKGSSWNGSTGTYTVSCKDGTLDKSENAVG